VTRKPDSWYQRRLISRAALYGLGFCAALLSAIAYGKIGFSGDTVLRLMIAMPFLLSVYDDQELSWTFSIWRRARLVTLTFAVLAACYFFSSTFGSLAWAIATIMMGYFSFAFLTIYKTLSVPSNFVTHKSLYDVLVNARKRRNKSPQKTTETK
jgi:hypothetical protein